MRFRAGRDFPPNPEAADQAGSKASAPPPASAKPRKIRTGGDQPDSQA